MDRLSPVAGHTASKNIQEALYEIQRVLKKHDLIGFVFLTAQSADREIPFVEGEQRTACLRFTGTPWNPLYDAYDKEKPIPKVAVDILDLTLGLTNLQSSFSAMSEEIDAYKQILREHCYARPELDAEVMKLLEKCRVRFVGIEEAHGKTQEKE